MTSETAKGDVDTLTGAVSAKSAYGIKIEGRDEWLNFSKEEYRLEPFDTGVKKGDRVRLVMSGNFIKSICKDGSAPASAPASAEAEGGGLSRSMSTDAWIAKQVCLKAATELYAGAHRMGDVPNPNDVVEAAELFWIFMNS